MHNLACCYSEGLGVPKSPSRAKEWNQKCADAGGNASGEKLAVRSNLNQQQAAAAVLLLGFAPLTVRPAAVRLATAAVADTRPAGVAMPARPAAADILPAAEVVIPAVAATPAAGITNGETLQATSLLNELLYGLL